MAYPYPYFFPDPVDGFYNQASPPEPNPDWIDPVEVNKTYLNNIKKDCVMEEFKGLKEENLYLLEVFVEEVEIRNDISESKEDKETNNPDITIKVKILNLPFMDTSESDTAKLPESNDGPKFTALLETIYNASGRHVSFASEWGEEQTGVEEETDNAQRGENEKDQNEMSEKDKQSKIEKERKVLVEKAEKVPKSVKIEQSPKDSSIKIMKGQSALFTMTGLAMIQNLQGHPVLVKATRNDTKNEDYNIEGDILGSTSVRVPDDFRLAVLRSSLPDSILPYLAVKSDKYQLRDAQDEEVGIVHLTIALSSFGKVIVNSVKQTDEDEYEFDNTLLFKSMEKSPENILPVNPEFAKIVIQMGLPNIRSDTSTEILKSCVTKNLIDIDPESKKQMLEGSSCEWFDMVKQSQGNRSSYSKEMRGDNSNYPCCKDKPSYGERMLEDAQSKHIGDKHKEKDYKSKEKDEKNKGKNKRKSHEKTNRKLLSNESTGYTHPTTLNFSERLSKLNKDRLNTVSEILNHCYSKKYLKADPNLINQESLPEFNWFSEIKRTSTLPQSTFDYKETEDWAEIVKLTTSLRSSDNKSYNAPKPGQKKFEIDPQVCKCLIRSEKTRLKCPRITAKLKKINLGKTEDDFSVLWVRHKQICRDLKRKCEITDQKKPSIYDRLEELRIKTDENDEESEDKPLEDTEIKNTNDPRPSMTSKSSKKSKRKSL
ncbi:uncharacterized protein LOC124370588 [Homalodisca vitripennis]|uniref:uncharacterized protein LOC124370588 n=1 Tax=Homalodisca vitripennis TaxID=197043 RepID=UPI001EEBC39D|nr:uncharacterized protein LOC124370588 [Homalodisca vitripennis]